MPQHNPNTLTALGVQYIYLCYHTWLSSIENECFPIFSITNGYTKTCESQVMNLENIHLLPLPFITREGTYRTKINFLMFPKWITNFHQYIKKPDLKRNGWVGYPKRCCKVQFRRFYLRSVGPPTQKLWPNLKNTKEMFSPNATHFLHLCCQGPSFFTLGKVEGAT